MGIRRLILTKNETKSRHFRQSLSVTKEEDLFFFLVKRIDPTRESGAFDFIVAQPGSHAIYSSRFCKELAEEVGSAFEGLP